MEMENDPGHLRVGLFARMPGKIGTLHPECEKAVRGAASALEELGHRVSESHPAALDRVSEQSDAFMAVVTSWVAVSLVWKWLLNPQYGLINYGLALIGIKGPSWLFDPNWAMAGVILTTIWKDIGFVTVIYLAGLQEIPENLGEASELDGATAWQKFWSVTWPMLAPTTFFVTTISLISLVMKRAVIGVPS